MGSPLVRKPQRPIEVEKWLAGTWDGKEDNKFRYAYCLRKAESLASIAKDLAGRRIRKDEPHCFDREMDWRKLAKFNFGTEAPEEINWYLRDFNGCRQTDSAGNNYVLGRDDAFPFLWIPISDTVFLVKSGTTVTIRQQDKGQALEAFFEDEKGQEIKIAQPGAKAFLVVRTSGMVARRVDFDLSDSSVEFEYEGRILDGGILHGIEVRANEMKIELRAHRR